MSQKRKAVLRSQFQSCEKEELITILCSKERENEELNEILAKLEAENKELTKLSKIGKEISILDELKETVEKELSFEELRMGAN